MELNTDAAISLILEETYKFFSDTTLQELTIKLKSFLWKDMPVLG